MPVLVDTGPLVALADARDRFHSVVVRFAAETRDPLVVPVTVLPEAEYLITEKIGAYASLAMLRSVARDELQLEGLTPGDFTRSVQLLEQYADSHIGFVDASIVVVGERLRITRILTLDRRHFRMVRPRHCAAFELVP